MESVGKHEEIRQRNAAMLILTRRIGETLLIEPVPGIDPDMTVRQLFESGPLVVALIDTKGEQGRIGIAAPDQLSIVRSELLDK